MNITEMSLKELWELFPIIFVDYDKSFERQYFEEEKILKSLLQENVKRISHIGSTAIKNIKTKPIVDILIEIENKKSIDKIKDILFKNGYFLMNEDLNDFKISFNKGYTINGYDDNVFHIHIKKYGDCDELYFRDYLNDNSEKAKEYENLKLYLYEKYKPDRDLYTEHKKDFVERIVELAKRNTRTDINYY